MSTVRTGAGAIAAAVPIPAERARSLGRWNRFLAVAHGGQFVLMLLVSRTTALFEPVVPTVRPLLTDSASSPTSPRSSPSPAATSR